MYPPTASTNDNAVGLFEQQLYNATDMWLYGKLGFVGFDEIIYPSQSYNHESFNWFNRLSGISMTNPLSEYEVTMDKSKIVFPSYFFEHLYYEWMQNQYV
jgi:hypothetical protein